MIFCRETVFVLEPRETRQLEEIEQQRLQKRVMCLHYNLLRCQGIYPGNEVFRISYKFVLWTFGKLFRGQ